MLYYRGKCKCYSTKTTLTNDSYERETISAVENVPNTSTIKLTVDFTRLPDVLSNRFKATRILAKHVKDEPGKKCSYRTFIDFGATVGGVGLLLCKIDSYGSNPKVIMPD